MMTFMGYSPPPFHLYTLTFKWVLWQNNSQCHNSNCSLLSAGVANSEAWLLILKLSINEADDIYKKNFFTNIQYFDCKFKLQPFSGIMTFKTVEPFFQWIGVQPHVLWLYEPLHVPGSIVCGKRRGWDLSLLPTDSCLLSTECSQEWSNSNKQPLWFERLYFLYLYLSHSVIYLFSIHQSSGWSLIMKCFVLLSLHCSFFHSYYLRKEAMLSYRAKKGSNLDNLYSCKHINLTIRLKGLKYYPFCPIFKYFQVTESLTYHIAQQV